MAIVAAKAISTTNDVMKKRTTHIFVIRAKIKDHYQKLTLLSVFFKTRGHVDENV